MNPEASKRLEESIQKTLSTHAKNNKSYLWMAYWVIFEREADPDGLEGWLNELNTGASRSTVINKMIEAHEFQQRLLGEEYLTTSLSDEENINSMLDTKLHSARMKMVRTLLPPAKVILDLGGYSLSDQRGALLQLGYPHFPEELYIRDLPPDKMMFPGPDWSIKVKYQSCNIEYVYGSMTDLSCFQQDYFDLVWSGESIEHITTEEAEKLFDQVYKLLKPGGKFALDTPNRKGTKLQFPNNYIHPEHKLEYYYDDLCKLLEKHNFKIIESKGIIDLSTSIEKSSMEHFNHEFMNSQLINDNPDQSYCFYICCMRAEDC
jgi:hypothetical protein